VQQAVYALLSSDATLLTLAGEVLDYEPEQPPAKFIRIGNATERAWNTLGGTGQGWGWENTLTVHCYSYYRGDLEVLQMLNRVTALMNHAVWSISGYQTAICEYGDQVTKMLIETKNKVERRWIPAVFTFMVHE